MNRIAQVLVPADDLALVPLDVVKEELGISPDDTSQDARLTRYILQSSAQIYAYCGQVFPLQTYRNTFYRDYSDNRSTPLLTSAWPIAEVLSLADDGAAVADYILDAEGGMVWRSVSHAYPWSLTTQIEFVAGYSVIPADLEAAAVSWMSARWYASGRDPTIRGETIPDLITVNYGSGGDTMSAVSDGIRGLLEPYKRPVLW